jgi:hypothetical protein
LEARKNVMMKITLPTFSHEWLETCRPFTMLFRVLSECHNDLWNIEHSMIFSSTSWVLIGFQPVFRDDTGFVPWFEHTLWDNVLHGSLANVCCKGSHLLKVLHYCSSDWCVLLLPNILSLNNVKRQCPCIRECPRSFHHIILSYYFTKDMDIWWSYFYKPWGTIVTKLKDIVASETDIENSVASGDDTRSGFVYIVVDKTNEIMSRQRSGLFILLFDTILCPICWFFCFL